MRQLPAFSVLEHVLVASAHVSVVQESMSSQGGPTPQVPPAVQRPQVVAAPSSQYVVVGRFDHAPGFAAGSQYWQGPFAAPFA